MKIIVTGGAGFIGSAVVRHLLNETDHEVVIVDKLTYASDSRFVTAVAANPRCVFEQVDICDETAISGVFDTQQPDAVLHLAAETHVDRSIEGPAAFVQSNVVGTYTLLDTGLRYWRGLKGAKHDGFRFQHISTDEVFGSLGPDGEFTEESPYRPNSPYAASKASSDHLVRAWHTTYDLPAIVTNCTNNYGPYQFPEKLIPLMVIKGLHGEPLPIYGRGENVRDWLFVEDHARALCLILEAGVAGETYNIGGRSEHTNVDVVQRLCALLDEMCPNAPQGSHDSLISYVADRPGHDLRYALDCGKIERELGWKPRETFETGLRKTVAWYLQNSDWWQPILAKTYTGERLGMALKAVGNG